MLRVGSLILVLCVTWMTQASAQVPTGISTGDEVRVRSSAVSGGFIVLHPGDEVRVRSSAASGRFIVLDFSDQALTLQGATTGDSMRIPLASITRLDVHRGRRSGGAGMARGAGYGLFAGVGTGALVGLASGDDQEGWLRFTKEEKALGYAIILGGLGAMIGAVVGASAPGDRWERVSPSWKVAAAPATGGRSALGVSFRF